MATNLPFEVVSTGGGTSDASAANQASQIALETAIRDRLPTALGQNTMANSFPVTLASDGPMVTATGAKADSAATDSTSAWSVVALLKGLWALLSGTIKVSGNASAGTAPTTPPLSVSGIDGGGLKRHILTDISGRQVIVSAPPIEVRNSLGALAASTTTYTEPPIDLGPAATRQHTLLMLTKSGVSSAGEVLNIIWSDDGVSWVYISPSSLGSASSSSSLSSFSAGSTCTQGRPMGRYARGVFVNGSTPQTALQLSMTALAGV